MFNLIKPGYVMRFGTDPGSIISPSHSGHAHLTSHLWPTTNTLGNINVISHPSGPIAEACAAAVGNRGGFSASRSLSYSKLGNFVREQKGTQDVAVGNSPAADFVGYTDGYTNYTPSPGLCVSKDFSGCLMVAYTLGAIRYVAHAAASNSADNDCKQAFLTELQNAGAVLHGWFRPFIMATDNAAKQTAMQGAARFLGGNFYKFTTFGVITAANQGFGITAFKPISLNLGTNDWVVTNVVQRPLSQSFVYQP